jgi:hypothetical protein
LELEGYKIRIQALKLNAGWLESYQAVWPETMLPKIKDL